MLEKCVEMRRIEQIIKIATGWLIGFSQFSPDGKQPHNRIVLLTNAKQCRLKPGLNLAVYSETGLKDMQFEEYDFPELKILSIACLSCPHFKKDCNLV